MPWLVVRSCFGDSLADGVLLPPLVCPDLPSAEEDLPHVGAHPRTYGRCTGSSWFLFDFASCFLARSVCPSRSLAVPFVRLLVVLRCVQTMAEGGQSPGGEVTPLLTRGAWTWFAHPLVFVRSSLRAPCRIHSSHWTRLVLSISTLCRPCCFVSFALGCSAAVCPLSAPGGVGLIRQGRR